MQPIAPLGLLLALAPLTTAAAQTGPWSTASLSQARGDLGAVTVDDLVLFAGGRTGNTLHNTVDIYDSSLGAPSNPSAWSMATLSVPRTFVVGTAVGHLALFGGGGVTIGVGTDVVDVFDASTQTWSTATLSEPRIGHAATTAGTKAFFAGGGHMGVPSATVDIYDSSLGAPSNPGAWSIATLSRARLGLVAVSVGDLAIFAGGHDFNTALADVDIYDCNTGVWSTASLLVARAPGPFAAVTVGSNVYIAGGLFAPGGTTSVSDAVDIYDAQAGTWSSDTLSEARGLVCAAAVGNTALFASGVLDGFVPSATIDILNVGNGQWGATSVLSQARFGACVASVGGKAIFGGGFGPTGPSAVVDVYEPVGVNYCLPTANSTGFVATIAAEGSSSIAANDLTLRAASLPANTFGYFLTSRIRGAVANPGGSLGHLCLGGAIGRYVGAGQVLNSGTGGEISLLLDLNTMPTPTGLVPAQAGETWHFQTWYRDSSSSNFTDAVSVITR